MGDLKRMKNNEVNYWPHFIIALVIFAAMLGVWTIKAAMDNPVELDNSFMVDYHKADEEISKILEKNIAFQKRYDISLLTPKIEIGKNEIIFSVKDKNKNEIKDANITLLFTRPDTTKFDKKLNIKYSNGYRALVNLDKEGRWNLIIKVKIKDFEGFKNYKLSTLE